MMNDAVSDESDNNSTIVNNKQKLLLIPPGIGIDTRAVCAGFRNSCSIQYLYVDDSSSESDSFLTDSEQNPEIIRYNNYNYTVLKRNNYRSWNPLNGSSYPDSNTLNLRQTKFSDIRNCSTSDLGGINIFDSILLGEPRISASRSTSKKKGSVEKQKSNITVDSIVNKSGNLSNYFKVKTVDGSLLETNDIEDVFNKSRDSASLFLEPATNDCDNTVFDIQSVSLLGNKSLLVNLRKSPKSDTCLNDKDITSPVPELNKMKRKNNGSADCDNDVIAEKRKKVENKSTPSKKRMLIDDYMKKSANKNVNDSDSSADVFIDNHRSRKSVSDKVVDRLSNEKRNKCYQRSSRVSEDESIGFVHRNDSSSSHNPKLSLGSQEINFGEETGGITNRNLHKDSSVSESSSDVDQINNTVINFNNRQAAKVVSKNINNRSDDKSKSGASSNDSSDVENVLFGKVNQSSSNVSVVTTDKQSKLVSKSNKGSVKDHGFVEKALSKHSVEEQIRNSSRDFDVNQQKFSELSSVSSEGDEKSKTDIESSTKSKNRSPSDSRNSKNKERLRSNISRNYSSADSSDAMESDERGHHQRMSENDKFSSKNANAHNYHHHNKTLDNTREPSRISEDKTEKRKRLEKLNNRRRNSSKSPSSSSEDENSGEKSKNSNRKTHVSEESTKYFNPKDSSNKERKSSISSSCSEGNTISGRSKNQDDGRRNFSESLIIRRHRSSMSSNSSGDEQYTDKSNVVTTDRNRRKNSSVSFSKNYEINRCKNVSFQKRDSSLPLSSSESGRHLEKPIRSFDRRNNSSDSDDSRSNEKLQNSRNLSSKNANSSRNKSSGDKRRESSSSLRSSGDDEHNSEVPDTREQDLPLNHSNKRQLQKSKGSVDREKDSSDSDDVRSNDNRNLSFKNAAVNRDDGSGNRRRGSSLSASSSGDNRYKSKVPDSSNRNSKESSSARKSRTSTNSEDESIVDKRRSPLNRKESIQTTILNSTVLPSSKINKNFKDVTLLQTPSFMNSMKTKPTSTPFTKNKCANDHRVSSSSASSDDENNATNRRTASASSDDENYVTNRRTASASSDDENLTNRRTASTSSDGNDVTNRQQFTGGSEDCDTDEEGAVNDRVDRYKSQIVPEAIKKIESKLVEGIRSEQFEEDLLFVEDISDNDEIWVAQCPKSLKVESLLGKKFDLTGKTTLSASTNDGETNIPYEAFTSFLSVERSDKNDVSPSSVNTKVNNVYCLIPSRKQRKLKLKAIETKGTIKIEERIFAPTSNTIKFTSSTEFTLPECLKIRHPLLGADYSEQLKALEYLNKTSGRASSAGSHISPRKDISDKSHRKKKKRKSRHSSPLNVETDTSLQREDVDNNCCNNLLGAFGDDETPSRNPKRKKKRRKLYEDEISMAVGNDPSHSGGEMDNTSFSHLSNRDFGEIEDNRSSSAKKKHKKKDRRSNDELNSNFHVGQPGINNLSDDDKEGTFVHKHNKKKKKKKH